MFPYTYLRNQEIVKSSSLYATLPYDIIIRKERRKIWPSFVFAVAYRSTANLFH